MFFVPAGNDIATPELVMQELEKLIADIIYMVEIYLLLSFFLLFSKPKMDDTS